MAGLVSVLTLLKGRRDHLSHLIDGLARSAERPGELIIVNMEDAPLSVPRQPFPVRVIPFPTGTSLPLGAARNRAAAAAQHRLLLFIDVDCIVSARCITRLREVLARQDCMLCPQVLYLRPRDSRTGRDLGLGLPHPVRSFPQQGTAREPNAGFLWGVAFAVRASTFYRLGGFDEQFTGYGAEDTDLGFTADAHGVKLIYLGGAPVFHQHHAIYDPPLQHFSDVVRNAALFHRKWGIWPMRDRLDAFVAAGLLGRTPTQLRIVRYPTEAEIAAARQGDEVLW